MNDEKSKQNEIEDVIDRSDEEDADVGTSIRYTISSYGADYPVDALIKRITRGDIYVPEFQRGFVWTNAQASRFIESLLLGLPVPGIFLFKEADTGKLVVVDGQQRLRSLQSFYDGILRGREFSLKGVCNEFADRTYKTLDEQDRRGLDDAILHATVFQQDDPADDYSSVYLIFERLNTGGTPLAPQEIRSSVFRGPFNDLLKVLAKDSNWQVIYGSPSPRAKDQELILRFFALLENSTRYERPMKGFLNDYMETKRHADSAHLEDMSKLFKETLAVAAKYMGSKAFRPERSLNAAVTDALLTGLAHRIKRGAFSQPDKLQSVATSLYANPEFESAVTSSTTNVSSVSRRLELARFAFDAVP